MKGPGKYDGLCSMMIEQTAADAVLVLVLGGHMGNGFSVQSREADITSLLPRLLRQVALQIETDLGGPGMSGSA